MRHGQRYICKGESDLLLCEIYHAALKNSQGMGTHACAQKLRVRVSHKTAAGFKLGRTVYGKMKRMGGGSGDLETSSMIRPSWMRRRRMAPVRTEWKDAYCACSAGGLNCVRWEWYVR
jgi:hypothetical protein